MGGASERFLELQREADEHRAVFLTTDLAICFTLAGVAETEYRSGAREHGDRAFASAERGYATISRFLNDPHHQSRMAPERVDELKSGLKRLRGRLDEIKREIV